MTLDLFSTTDVRKIERFDYWHNFTCRSYSTTECRQLTDGPVNAAVATQILDNLLLCDVAVAPNWPTRFWRGPDEIRRSPVEKFSLFAVEVGKVGVAQGTNRTLIGPGEIALYYQDIPFTLELPTGLRAIHLTFPRTLLTARVPTAFNSTAVGLKSRLSRMAGEIFRQLLQLDIPSDSNAARRLCGSALDVLSAAIEWDSAERPDSESEPLEKAKSFMLANRHDAELDVEKIAQATGVAQRTLYRYFAADGTSPMRWLWKRRLDASFAALSEGKATRVTDVAMSFGFSDLSHFSRLFKNTFGCTPQSLKRKGCT
jgi:AraC-like DNA-binding protein